MRFFLSILSVVVLLSPAWARRVTEDEIADIKRTQEENNLILADTVQNLTTLRQEIQALKGSIDEAKHFFEEGSQRSDRVLKDFDLRLTGIEERLTLYGTQLEEVMTKTAAAGTKGKTENEESELYRKALAEVNLQNYKSAITFFDQFLKKFPKSTLADNAQYWKGEALFALKAFPQAVLEFQKVVQKYPKSEKAPGAVLKQGYCFFETKEYLDAKAFLQKVITNYPSSGEAAAAKEKLQKINQILNP